MLFDHASREFRLVARCCAPPACGPVDAAAFQEIDWPLVVELAKRHRVGGLVHRALLPVGAVPPAERAALGRLSTEIVRGNLASVAMLAAIARAMTQENVAFTVQKGLPLGKRVTGSLTVRQSKDIDLGVAPEQVAAADRAMRAAGFRRLDAGGLTPAQEAAFQRYRKHNEYLHPATGVQVELHWRASENAEFTFADAGATQRFELAPGLLVQIPPEDDLLLSLCLHGASHAWFRLKWVADVAALLAEAGPAGVAALSQRARAQDLDRPVEQVLLVCAALYPALALPVASPSRTGRWLAEVAADALLQQDLAAPSAGSAFVPRRLKRSRLLLRRSWRYRTEELRLQAASPADWRAFPLPAALHFLYPALRLPLWLLRRRQAS